MKKLACLLIITLLCEVLILSVQFGQVQASQTVNGIIFTDTTWTKSQGPYTFSGPVAVNKGATLTIEAGTTIDIGCQYYLQVNGTLEVLGSQNAPVQFNSGQIIFTETANGWDEESKTGCRIENANFTYTQILSNVALKMVNSQINADIRVLDGSGKRSFFSNNNVRGTLEISNADIFDSSISILKASNSQLIHSTITAGITGNSLMIDGCKINGSGGTPYGAVSAMKLEGKVTITNSVISGGGTSYDFFFRDTYEVTALEIEHGQVIISNNTITGTIKVSLENEPFQSVTSEFSHNIVSNKVKIYGDQTIIFDNQVDGSIVASGSSIVIQNNTVQGISFGGSQIVVSDNLVVNGSGIDAVSEGSAVIERNLIRNNHQGIQCNSGGLIIRNNTLKDNRIAVYVSTPDHIELIYNNILNCSDSIVLTSASNFEAANNYWMPNDKVSIDNSIHDYYDDFNLGKVNYSPVLTEPNMQAMPDPNAKPPEAVLNEVNQNQTFPLQVALAAVVVAVVFAGAALAVIKDRKSKKRA
jgi:hypothetical protein